MHGSLCRATSCERRTAASTTALQAATGRLRFLIVSLLAPTSLPCTRAKTFPPQMRSARSSVLPQETKRCPPPTRRRACVRLSAPNEAKRNLRCGSTRSSDNKRSSIDLYGPPYPPLLRICLHRPRCRHRHRPQQRNAPRIGSSTRSNVYWETRLSALRRR